MPDCKQSETSHIQSQLYVDDSVESIADADLEDGELEKTLTSAQVMFRKLRVKWSCRRERKVDNTLKLIEGNV